VRRKMPGGFKPKKTNVRKLSFAPNHLFPYLVPRDRRPAKLRAESRPGDMILTEFRVAKAP
jgi:hypothetical protein